MTIPVDRIISMTELQKLSLRKLREMGLEEAPLVVRDNRSRRSRFVILHHETYERLLEDRAGPAPDASGLGEVDFAGRGLFWDRPTMTNERFAGVLADPRDPDHRWAWTRAFERLPSGVLTRGVGLSDLHRLVSLVKLRPRLRAAWEAALGFWTAQARRRLS